MKDPPVRYTQSMLLTLPPEDLAQAKRQAGKLGMTVSGYVASLLRMREQPPPRPAVDWILPAQIAQFVAEALRIAREKQYADIAEPLVRANALLFEEMLKHQESYERAVDEQSAGDDMWHSV